MGLKRIANVSMAVLLTVALAAPGIGCVTTKKVAHTATFGLVGDKEGIQNAKEEKQAKKQAEREREEQKKADKRERKRARKEAEEQEKAEKKARKQAKKDAEDAESEKPKEERGFWNKATLGMVGGGDKPEEKNDVAQEAEKTSKKEAKRARKQEKREAEQAKKAEKRERKEARKQEERDKEAAKKQAKQERREAKAAGDGDEKEDRGFWNKATLGLVGGGDKTEEEQQAEAAPEPSEKAAKKEEKRARKEARKQEERDKEAAKKQAKQERKEAKAQEKSEKEQQESEKEERGFWSKATFGLVGGGKEEADAPQDAAAQPEQAAAASSEAGVKEAESVDVAKADEQAPPVDPPTPIRGEHKGLAKLSFKTAVTKEGETRSGLAKLVASRRTYSDHGYGICDLGDVRIAVKGMTFPGEARAGGVVIQSDERGVAAGKSGRGNEAFAFQYEKGVTNCVFGTVQFSISKGVLTMDGHEVSMVSGRKLVVVNESGKVDAVYNIGK